MDAAPRMSALEWSLLALLSILWGGAFFFAKAALDGFGPLSIVLGRVVIGSIALLSLALFMGYDLPRQFAPWRDFAIMGLLNNVIPFSLIFWGQQEIASGLAATLTASTPIFAILVAKALQPELRVRAGQIAGIGFGILGVGALVGPAVFHQLDQGVAGMIAVLGAAGSYALAGRFGRRFRSLPPVVAATGQVTCAAVIMAPVALLIERPWLGAMPGAMAWSCVAALGILCTAVAYLIFFRVLASAGAVNIVLVTIMVPPSAILFGFLFLGETLSPGDLLGMALIAVGLLAIDGRALSWFSRAWPSGAR
jgi:drug/metabolite transporter (DMT)-like permease